MDYEVLKRRQRDGTDRTFLLSPPETKILAVAMTQHVELRGRELDRTRPEFRSWTKLVCESAANDDGLTVYWGASQAHQTLKPIATALVNYECDLNLTAKLLELNGLSLPAEIEDQPKLVKDMTTQFMEKSKTPRLSGQCNL